MIDYQNQFSNYMNNNKTTNYYSFNENRQKKIKKNLSSKLLIETKNTFSGAFTKNSPFSIKNLKYQNSQKTFFYSNTKINKYNEGKKIYNEIRRRNFAQKIKTKSELNIFHIDHIKEKIFQFQYQRKQQLPNENLNLPNKKNYFITSLSEERSNKNNKSNKLKTSILDLDKIKSNIEIENNNTNLYIKYIKSLNLNNKTPKKTTEVSIPNIKFSSILQNYFSDILSNNDILSSSEIESNKESIDTIIKRKNAKFRYKIINKIQREKLLRLAEENETISFITNKLNLFKIIEKYFYKLNDSFRRYIIFLFNKINHGNKELKLLWQKKSKLLKEIFEIKKKINLVSEKRHLLIDMKLLCIMIKYGVKSLKELPLSIYKKYNIDKTIRNNSPKRKIEKFLMKRIKFQRRRSYAKLEIPENILTIQQRRRAITPKHKINYKIIEEGFIKQNVRKKRRTIEVPNNNNNKYRKKKALVQFQIFNNAEELMQRFQDIENKIKDSYNQYNKIFSMNIQLKVEKKELDDYYEHYMSGKYEEQLIIELKKEKLLNKKLLDKRDEIYFGVNNTNKKGEIYNKLKNIILNFDINIEKFLEVSNVYDTIKNKDRKKVNYNGKRFSKEMFILKIIELLLTKLIEWKYKLYENTNLKKEYLALKKDHLKKKTAFRVKQKKHEDYLKRLKTVDKMIAKNNNMLFLPIKKYDPFEKKLLEKMIIKKQKGNVSKSKTIGSNQIYEEFIQY